MGGAVLCVLVVYGRRPSQAAAWDRLVAERDRPEPSGTLRLAHILVYDNSPVADWEEIAPQAGLTLFHDPGNGGTVAAYRTAAELACRLDCERVLLLDHDTILPEDYLARLSRADPTAAAIVPHVHDTGRLVSPAWCSGWGGMTPTTDLTRRDVRGFVTAISSGALLKPSILSGAEPFARGMWLDYVDHWIFLSLARAGGQVVLADVVIDHALSVLNPAELSARRVDSILDGERALASQLGWRARVTLPLRHLLRAARLTRVNPAAARRVVVRMFRPGPAWACPDSKRAEGQS